MRMLRRKDHRIEYNVLISIYNFTTTKKRHIEIFKINILRIVRYSIRILWNFLAIHVEKKYQAKYILFTIKCSRTLYPLEYTFASLVEYISLPIASGFNGDTRVLWLANKLLKSTTQNYPSASENLITWRDQTFIGRVDTETLGRSRHAEQEETYHTYCWASAWQLSISSLPHMDFTVLFWYQNKLVMKSRKNKKNIQLWVAYFGT